MSSLSRLSLFFFEDKRPSTQIGIALLTLSGAFSFVILIFHITLWVIGMFEVTTFEWTPPQGYNPNMPCCTGREAIE